MRVVITGGAGFVGSHLCDRFVADGHAVVCLDDLCTGHRRNVAHLEGRAGFEFRQLDVSEPFEVDGPVDAVLHFASPASPVHYLRLPIQTLRVGSLGTMNGLELARAKGARFLMASTSECYGDPLVHPQTEDYWGNVNPNGPRSVYDEAKRFSEALTMAWHRTHGVDTRIVRIFNTYGPRMNLADGRVVPAFMDAALKGEPLPVAGDGSQTRSFCYVSDLVEGIVRLLASGFHEPVNLGNPEEHTILEFARIVAEVTGRDTGIRRLPLPVDDPRKRQPDITRARTLLGWEPVVPLVEGLRRTAEYFRTLAPVSP